MPFVLLLFILGNIVFYAVMLIKPDELNCRDFVALVVRRDAQTKQYLFETVKMSYPMANQQ